VNARRRAIVVTAGVVVALATFAAPMSAAAADDPLIEVAGILVDQPGLGPELCVGAVELSLPPRCRGLEITGKSFEAVPPTVSVESSGGVRFTDWAVFRGRLHGRTVRLTKVTPNVRPKTPPPPSPTVSHLSPPDADCPADGRPGVQPWEAAAFLDETAARYPATYAGGWIDPQGRVTARFTDAPGEYEADLRSRFSGSLCVDDAEFTLAALKALHAQLITELLPVLERYDRRFTSGAVNEPRNDVDVGIDLPVPTAMREELRRRYGPALHLMSSVRVVG
jgi:hypothetical protein